MPDSFAHLPEDIAAEKRTAADLRENYKGKLLGGLRNFSALREQAPGVIAERSIGTVITIVTLLALFHDLNAVGLVPVVSFCVKFLLVVAVCFWVTGKIWVAVGLRVRDRIRYLVKHFWVLASTALVVVSLVLTVFLP